MFTYMEEIQTAHELYMSAERLLKEKTTAQVHDWFAYVGIVFNLDEATHRYLNDTAHYTGHDSADRIQGRPIAELTDWDELSVRLARYITAERRRQQKRR